MKKTLSLTLATLVFATFVLPAVSFAESNGNEAMEAHITSVSASYDATCVKAAISTREDAIIAANDTFNASIKSALVARKAGLLAAADKTTVKERAAARKTVRDTFQASAKSAHTAMKAARKTTYESARVALKACGGSKETLSENNPVTISSQVAATSL